MTNGGLCTVQSQFPKKKNDKFTITKKGQKRNLKNNSFNYESRLTTVQNITSGFFKTCSIIRRQSGQITNGTPHYVRPTQLCTKCPFTKTKYKLYTTSLNILKCCNTFKTFSYSTRHNSVK